MLHTFALSLDAVRRVMRRSMLRLQVVVTLSFAAFGMYLLTSGRPVEIGVATAVVVVIGLAYFFILFFNYRVQLRLLYSVRVDVDGASITYRQAGQEPRRVLFSLITRLSEQTGGLLVETGDSSQALLVPNGLARNGDEYVRKTLSVLQPIESLPARGSPVRGMLNLFGFIVALLVVVFANSLWLVVPLGVFLLIYGFYAERRLEKSPAVAPGTVRLYNSAFSFLLFVILMKSCVLTFILAMASAR